MTVLYKFPYLYFIITRNCNLKCRHCYLDAGPERSDTTISKDDFAKVIDNLPKKVIELCISGGEIFTIQDTLFDYLSYIKEKNLERRANNQGEIGIMLQTNAFWASSQGRIVDMLNKLIPFNIEYLDVGSDDEFHYEQGLKAENIERLTTFIRWNGIFSNFRPRGNKDINHIMPIGRAKNLGITNPTLGQYGAQCKGSLDYYDVTIMEDGSVFPCCFNFFQLPGNLIDDSLDEIIKNSLEDERLSMLSSKGIERLAVFEGWSPLDVQELIDAYGPCGFCYRYHQQNK